MQGRRGGLYSIGHYTFRLGYGPHCISLDVIVKVLDYVVNAGIRLVPQEFAFLLNCKG